MLSTFFGFSQFNSSAPWMKNTNEIDSKPFPVLPKSGRKLIELDKN
jgi:hypothetical protein